MQWQITAGPVASSPFPVLVMSPVLKLQAFHEAAAISESVGIEPTIPVYVADRRAVTAPTMILRTNITRLL